MVENNQTIGKYGLLRLQFIQQHCPVFYQSMLFNNELSKHLAYIDEKASKEVQQLLDKLIKASPPPEKKNTEEWAQHMNSLKHQAEEIVLNTLVYI